ncbi:glycosyltransferase [Mucilaginibacter limnophilus]|uniref:Glycosyltransferase n=1 Tax=Mucilaginibacter limnophilus TaxID=1932778 RepID=A0A437MI09_9SPHI|nr:glycosyltransferase [Mucilaginibacter limnophilus]RVT97294.1 glycosyltransferase [Mucilaginibacter limnophilus]
MDILVSVVIPTYRRPQLLSKCLKALLLQKFDKSRYEIIVVSDGPDEQTKQIFNDWVGYDFPIMRYLPMAEKKGPAAARNHGWRNARGRIIAFTDDDCLPDMYWLNEIVNHCHPDENVALTGKVIVPLSKRPTDYELNTAHLQTADFITANCACTKQALELSGGFDEQFRMAWREDSDLEFKLISKHIPIKKIESAVVTHPVRNSRWGVSIKEQKKTMFDALLYKKYPDMFRHKIRAKSPVLYYAIILAFLVMLVGLFTQHQQVFFVGFAAWAGLTTYFIYKRLSNTSLSPAHVSEMVITSLFIPFLSVYWQWYGAVKYRVLFV